MPIYRSDVRDPLPSVEEWADTLDLTRRGREWIGPVRCAAAMIGFTSGTLEAGRRSVAVAASTGNPTARGGRGSANYYGRCSRLGPSLRRVSRPGCPATPPAPVNGHEAALARFGALAPPWRGAA